MLSGEGKAFCSGRDLSDAEPATEDAQSILADTFNPLFSRIRYLDLPTFAAVHDVRRRTRRLPWRRPRNRASLRRHDRRRQRPVGSPFARIGAVLDSGGHHHLVHRFGEHRALELIYTGRLLNGTEATEWDLVNRAVPEDELLDETLAVARRVCRGHDTGVPVVEADHASHHRRRPEL